MNSGMSRKRILSYEYDTLAEAFAMIAATANSYGDGMVATWGLFRSTPMGVDAEVIAEGARVGANGA